MASPSSQHISDISRHLDKRIRRVDEPRWLSSRYAPHPGRFHLIALYAFYYELARIRTLVTETALGSIRFQWWRDTLRSIQQTRPVSRHDVIDALYRPIVAGVYSCDSLIGLVDKSEAAFIHKDRTREPESQLAIMAANTLMPDHGWHDAIASIAPRWAALRRGETAVAPRIIAARAPVTIRPAIAHFRLARSWAAGRQPGALSCRAILLRAIMSGHV